MKYRLSEEIKEKLNKLYLKMENIDDLEVFDLIHINNALASLLKEKIEKSNGE
jgi:hypothetical protein